MNDVVVDLKPNRRIDDSELLGALHEEWEECVLCLWHRGRVKLSLHHVHKHPRNDVRGNLVMLCGDGTTGCHGLIEMRDPTTCLQLGRYIISERPDIVGYLYRHLGEEQAKAWARRHLWLSL